VALRREQWSSWGVITIRNEPWGRKAKLITDIRSTALRKEEMAVHLWALRDEQP
jgi:hypothetical protein